MIGSGFEHWEQVTLTVSILESNNILILLNLELFLSQSSFSEMIEINTESWRMESASETIFVWNDNYHVQIIWNLYRLEI